jgi:MarR family
MPSHGSTSPSPAGTGQPVRAHSSHAVSAASSAQVEDPPVPGVGLQRQAHPVRGVGVVHGLDPAARRAVRRLREPLREVRVAGAVDEREAHDPHAQARVMVQLQEGAPWPTVTRAATRMETAGLLRRAPHPSDARLVRLCLTAKGRALEATIAEEMRGLSARALQGLDDEERKAFVAALHTITANLR